MLTIRRTIEFSVLVAALLSLIPGNAGAVPAPDLPGAYAVGHTEMTIIDAARANRVLPLQIWYPADEASWAAEPSFTFTALVLTAGITSTVAKNDAALPAGDTYPLIIFSHGFGGFNIQSLSLMEHLASFGFVVVAPNHTGNTQADQSSLDPEADRLPDVAFTIDEMAAANLNGASSFFGHIDANNVGVAGHSYGGMTALFMAAGHGGLLADPRVKAIMPVAPSSASLTDAELQGITIPTLLMVGTLDGLRPETARSYGLISSAPDLFRVDVTGANHTHFANVCDIGNVLIANGIGPESWAAVGAAALVPIYESTCVPPAFSIDEATRLQNLFAAALFRTYLSGDPGYAAYLTSTYAITEPDIVFYPDTGVDLPMMGVVAQLVLGIGVASAGFRRLRRGKGRRDS